MKKFEDTSVRIGYCYTRSSYFFEAFWLHLYCSHVKDSIRSAQDNARWPSAGTPAGSAQTMNDIIEICTLCLVVFVTFPIYMLSKIVSVLMPLFIFIYFYVDGDGIILFLDVDTFQVTMWCLYVFMISVWFCLMYGVMRREYILWHLQPSNRHLLSISSMNIPKLKKDIEKRYENIQIYPIIKECLHNLFSDDVRALILEYFDCIQIE